MCWLGRGRAGGSERPASQGVLACGVVASRDPEVEPGLASVDGSHWTRARATGLGKRVRALALSLSRSPARLGSASCHQERMGRVVKEGAQASVRRLCHQPWLRGQEHSEQYTAHSCMPSANREGTLAARLLKPPFTAARLSRWLAPSAPTLNALYPTSPPSQPVSGTSPPALLALLAPLLLFSLKQSLYRPESGFHRRSQLIGTDGKLIAVSCQPWLLEKIGRPLPTTLALPCSRASALANYGIWILIKRMNMHTTPACPSRAGCNRRRWTMSPTKLWGQSPRTTTPPTLRLSTTLARPHHNQA